MVSLQTLGRVVNGIRNGDCFISRYGKWYEARYERHPVLVDSPAITRTIASLDVFFKQNHRIHIPNARIARRTNVQTDRRNLSGSESWTQNNEKKCIKFQEQDYQDDEQMLLCVVRFPPFVLFTKCFGRTFRFNRIIISLFLFKSRTSETHSANQPMLKTLLIREFMAIRLGVKDDIK